MADDNCLNCKHIKMSTDICAMGQTVENHEWKTKKCSF